MYIKFSLLHYIQAVDMRIPLYIITEDWSTFSKHSFKVVSFYFTQNQNTKHKAKLLGAKSLINITSECIAQNKLVFALLMYLLSIPDFYPFKRECSLLILTMSFYSVVLICEEKA